MNALIPPLTEPQILLLRAALLHGDAALDAWRRWQAITDVDHLDTDSQWLLPLLYCNLRTQGADEARLLRYRSVYCHNWYRNNLLFHAAAGALRACGLQGSDVLVLKGTALALLCYDSPGARPLSRLDLLLMPAALERLEAYLCGEGWHVSHNPDGACFTDAVGRQIAARHTIAQGSLPGVPGDRSRVSAVRLHNLPVLAPGPADLLVHLWADRAGWDERSVLLWFADLARLPGSSIGRAASVLPAGQADAIGEMLRSVAALTGIRASGSATCTGEHLREQR